MLVRFSLFCANEVISTHFRLATLTCQANVSDLLAYMDTGVFPVIQENVRTCVTRRMSVPSDMVRTVNEINNAHVPVIAVIICPARAASLRFPACCF